MKLIKNMLHYIIKKKLISLSIEVSQEIHTDGIQLLLLLETWKRIIWF